jgi:hypothetical protein
MKELFSSGMLDVNRGNWTLLDFGYASGQNLEHDLNAYVVTCPWLLDHTKENCFLEVLKQISMLSDSFGGIFGLPQNTIKVTTFI